MGYLVTKSYDSVFILDISKLTRLLNIVEERFKGLGITPIPFIELITKKGKSFTSSDVKSILDHDNSLNNPISVISIEYRDLNEKPNYLCNINYNKRHSEVNIRIKSDEMRWGNDLFAEMRNNLNGLF